jgi:hypothetical protein
MAQPQAYAIVSDSLRPTALASNTENVDVKMVFSDQYVLVDTINYSKFIMDDACCAEFAKSLMDFINDGQFNEKLMTAKADRIPADVLRYKFSHTINPNTYAYDLLTTIHRKLIAITTVSYKPVNIVVVLKIATSFVNVDNEHEEYLLTVGLALNKL